MQRHHLTLRKVVTALNAAKVEKRDTPEAAVVRLGATDRILSRFLRDDRRVMEVTRVIPGPAVDVEVELRTRLLELGLVEREAGDSAGATTIHYESPLTFLRFGNPSRLRRALDVATIRWVEVDLEAEGDSPPRTRVTLRCPLDRERRSVVLGGAYLSGTVGGIVGGGIVTVMAGSAGVVGALVGITGFAAVSVLAGLPIPGYREFRRWAHREAEAALEEVLELVVERRKAARSDGADPLFPPEPAGTSKPLEEGESET